MTQPGGVYTAIAFIPAGAGLVDTFVLPYAEVRPNKRVNVRVRGCAALLDPRDILVLGSGMSTQCHEKTRTFRADAKRHHFLLDPGPGDEVGLIWANIRPTWMGGARGDVVRLDVDEDEMPASDLRGHLNTMSDNLLLWMGSHSDRDEAKDKLDKMLGGMAVEVANGASIPHLMDHLRDEAEMRLVMSGFCPAVFLARDHLAGKQGLYPFAKTRPI